MTNPALLIDCLSHSDLRYWNPNLTVGSATGGNGTWDTYNANWTINNTRNVQFVNDLAASVVFPNNGSVTVSNTVKLNKIAMQNSGGSYAFSGGTIYLQGTAPEINVISAGTITFSTTTLSGSAGTGLVKSGSGNLVFTVPCTIPGGTLTSSSGGIYLQNSAYLGFYTLNLTNTFFSLGNASTNVSNRMNSSSVTISQGTEISYAGNASTDTVEDLAVFTLGSGNSTTTITQGNSGRVASITGSTLLRPSRGTMFVRGSSLGTQNVSVGKFGFGSTPSSLIGGTSLPAGTGSTKNLPIFPFIFSTTSVSNTTWNALSTYDTNFNSIRGLATAEYDANTITNATAGNNVKFTAASDTVSASKALNSLLFAPTSAQSVTIASGVFLGLSSGVLAQATSTGTQGGTGYTTTIVGSGGSGITFGNEGVVAVAQTSGAITTQCTTNANNNGAVTKTGAGTWNADSIIVNGGNINVNQGTLAFGSVSCSNIYVHRGGKISPSSNAAISYYTNIVLNAGSAFYWNFSGTMTVKTLQINGVFVPAGTYTTPSQVTAYDSSGSVLITTSNAASLVVSSSS